MVRRWMPIALAAGVITVAAPALAQRFLTYRCGDGSEFVMGFYDGTRQVAVQLDGRSMRMSRTLSISGTRYAKGGVSISMKGEEATLKRRGVHATTCTAG